MFLKYKDKLISSDWHILHKNIFIYEFEKRKRFLIDNIPEVNSLLPGIFDSFDNRTEEGKKAVYETIKLALYGEKSKQEIKDMLYKANVRILDEAIATLKKTDVTGIKEYYNLGDYIWGFDSSVIELLESKLLEIKNFFKGNNIRQTLILGNHDEFSGKEVEIMNYYNEHFDEVCFYKVEGRDVYTHHPINSSNGKYPVHGVFAEIDKELLKKSKGGTVNIHGHVHGNEFDCPLSGIEYINVSLDVLI